MSFSTKFSCSFYQHRNSKISLIERPLNLDFQSNPHLYAGSGKIALWLEQTVKGPRLHLNQLKAFFERLPSNELPSRECLNSIIQKVEAHLEKNYCEELYQKKIIDPLDFTEKELTEKCTALVLGLTMDLRKYFDDWNSNDRSFQNSSTEAGTAVLTSVFHHKLYEKASSAAECELPDVGNTREVNYQSAKHGFSARYFLHRKSSNQITLKVPINFKFLIDKETPELDKQIQQSFINRYEECLKKTQPLQWNGLHISIEIDPYSSSTLAPHLMNVWTKNNFPRPDSKNLNTNVLCSTLVHELGHMIGLDDLYKERLRGLARNDQGLHASYVPVSTKDPGQTHHTRYDCRPTSSKSSLMKSDREYSLDKSYCACPQGKDCEGFFSKAKVQKTISEEECRKDGMTIYFEGDVYRLPKTAKILIPSSRSKQPGDFFLPNELSALLYPGCWEKNKLYYLCTREAYRSSFQAGGEGCDPILQQLCADERWLHQEVNGIVHSLESIDLANPSQQACFPPSSLL